MVFPDQSKQPFTFQGDPGIDSYLQGPDGEKGRRGHQVRWSLFTWGYWCTWGKMIAVGSA